MCNGTPDVSYRFDSGYRWEFPHAVHGSILLSPGDVIRYDSGYPGSIFHMDVFETDEGPVTRPVMKNGPVCWDIDLVEHKE